MFWDLRTLLMERGHMFSSGYRKFFVLLFLFACAVVAGSYARFHWPASAPAGGNIAGAWSVEKSGSGLAVRWNFDAPLFHDAGNVALEIEDGKERRKIPLNRSERAGTLFYTPREADVTLRLRIQPTVAGEAEKTEVIRLGSQKAEVVAEKPKRAEAVPEEVPDEVPGEGTRSRLDVPLSIWRVRAFAPHSLTSRLDDDGMEVPVYVKIEPSGKVTAASTRKYDDATEVALAKIATEAALRWKFQALKGRRNSNVYRDFVIHFKFPKT